MGKTQLIVDELPAAKSALAQHVVGLAGNLSKYVSPAVNPMQFISMVISEGNTLAMSLTPEEMAHPKTKASFAKAAFNAAVVGLMPGPALGHCYFVPYKRYRGTPREYKEIVYVPGYRGFLELAFASKFLVQCDPEVVLRGELCTRGHNQDGPWINHDIPTPRGQACDRKTLIGVYCTYRTARGGRGVVYMDRDRIDAIDTNRDIWTSNYEAMCLKSPIRAASKRWHLTRQLAAAITLDEEYEEDRSQSDLAGVAQVDVTPEIDLNAIGGGE